MITQFLHHTSEPPVLLNMYIEKKVVRRTLDRSLRKTNGLWIRSCRYGPKFSGLCLFLLPSIPLTPFDQFRKHCRNVAPMQYKYLAIMGHITEAVSSFLILSSHIVTLPFGVQPFGIWFNTF